MKWAAHLRLLCPYRTKFRFDNSCSATDYRLWHGVSALKAAGWLRNADAFVEASLTRAFASRLYMHV